MKTGAELIAIERDEQINKHGYNVGNDTDYGENELIKAALFCINSQVFEWPFDWSSKSRDKILYSKDEVQRLTVAGAFIAAQIDRIQLIEQERVDADPKSWE